MYPWQTIVIKSHGQNIASTIKAAVSTSNDLVPSPSLAPPSKLIVDYILADKNHEYCFQIADFLLKNTLHFVGENDTSPCQRGARSHKNIN